MDGGECECDPEPWPTARTGDGGYRSAQEEDPSEKRNDGRKDPFEDSALCGFHGGFCFELAESDAGYRQGEQGFKPVGRLGVGLVLAPTGVP